MELTAQHLTRISKGKPKASIVKALVDAPYAKFGLDAPHRLAQFIAQIAHESDGFSRDVENLNYTAKRIREVFKSRVKTDAEAAKLAGNPRALANKVYGNRKDLGNGGGDDGYNYRGRTPKQITGKYNYGEFTKWARKHYSDAPDFVAEPDRILEQKWLALSAIWFWDRHNLNAVADRGDNETVTRIINGGTNGLVDRLDYYDRTALVFLGYPVNGLKQFQTDAKKRGDYLRDIDGLPGPGSRSAMHQSLVKLTKPAERAETVQAAPVVAEKPVAVVAPEKPWWQSKEVIAPVLTGGGLTAGSTMLESFGRVPWQNLIVLLVVGFAGLVGYLLYSRNKERKEIEKRVVKIEAASL